MKLAFEVMKFFFELIYFSYIYEINSMKEEFYLEEHVSDAEFIQERRDEKKEYRNLAKIS